MTRRFAELTAFVLAGGASRRMGRPKHELMLAGEPLLARTLRQARSVARSVIILAPEERARGLDFPAVPDELQAHGPLGAIYTGLAHTRTELNLFLGCDLPFMEPRFLRYLATQAIGSGADATLAETPGEGLQPLAAIYRRRALPAVRRSLRNGQKKVTRFFRWVNVRVLGWPELARAGFRGQIFDNLNTVEDYERTIAKIGR
ncbi:MAG TPA: molybdenum cofactor guanylyltransferase [Terriglobia bacterium]